MNTKNQDLSNKINNKSHKAGTNKSLLKGLIFFMTVFCLLTGTRALTVSAASKGYLDVSGSWNLYKYSSLKTKICKVPEDAEVTLLKLNEKYAKIQFTLNGKKKTGYVKAKAFAFTSEPASFQLKGPIDIYKRNYVDIHGKLVAKGEKITTLASGRKVYVFGFEEAGIGIFFNAGGGYARVAYEDGNNLRFGWCDRDAYEKCILRSSGKDQYKIIKTGYYQIANREYEFKFGVCATEIWGRGGSHAWAVILPHVKEPAGKVKIVHVKDGWHKIISPIMNNNCLKQTNYRIDFGTYTGTDAQLWKFIDAGNGCVYVMGKADDKNRKYYWEAAETDSDTIVADLIMNSFRGGSEQQWRISKW